ncbi:iron-sulfur cluster biosynthesis family protein [Paenibacillus cymbidii]|uniref:iron-sulfur cluster biosynthesis family protein n=1 Tax=Paenibacillus cymbidii TaxID=1639034 RepID=UPI0010810E34|nr:iron-sulfur cluster biosynthesis family protein [Paenibacillus cymbidii]
MQMTVSNPANERIRERFGSGPLRIKLDYDTEGCGCAVSGVPALRLVPQDVPLAAGTGRGDDAELAMETIGAGGITFIIERRHVVFFEERLLLDVKRNQPAFLLKSDCQIYHSMLNIENPLAN